MLLATSTFQMLIYFFSDRNYMLRGFYAKYTVSECPFNCHSQGNCELGTCKCLEGFTGESCELSVCPNECSEHGTCVDGRCQCHEGYAGYDCRLHLGGATSAWITVAPEGTGLKPRAGHAGVFVSSMNSLYVFGGNSLNKFFSDFVRYNFNTSQWEEVGGEAEPWPLPRHGHAMVAHGNSIYLFGGVLGRGRHSSELWVFKLATGVWSLMAGNSSVQPRPVASHTLTVVEDTWIYLFGGRTAVGEFVSDIFRIRMEDDAEWEVVTPRGGRAAMRRLVGHSAVYHKESRSLLVFGGFLPDYARFPKRTNALHAFHIEENYWTEINYDTQDVKPPEDTAFHSAVLMGNYLVVYGGNSHIHHSVEVCYDKKIYFYHLGCHRWVDHIPLQKAFSPGQCKRHFVS